MFKKIKPSVHWFAAGIFITIWAALLFTDNRFGKIADYYLFMGQFFSNRLYFLKNGFFNIPYYTPAIGSGTPMYADLQSMNFSLPQILFNVLPEPYLALKTAFIISVALSYIGSFLFFKKFGFQDWISAAGSLIFSLNGFNTCRWIVGHLTFHTYFLVPWFLLVLKNLNEDRPTLSRLRWCVAGAVILSLLVYASDINSIYILMLLSSTFLLTCKCMGLSWKKLNRTLLWTIFVTVPLACLIFLSRGLAMWEHLQLFPRNTSPNILKTIHIIWLFPNSLFNPLPSAGSNHALFGGWSELSAYVGLSLVAGIFIAVSRLLRRRREGLNIASSHERSILFFFLWSLFLTVLVGILMRGEGPVWTVLNKLPVISSYHVLTRFMGSLPLAVIGLWVAAVHYILKVERQKLLGLILGAVAVFDILSFNATNGSKSHAEFGDLYFPSYERELRVLRWKPNFGYQFFPMFYGDPLIVNPQYSWKVADVDPKKPALYVHPDKTFNVNDPVAITYPDETGKKPWSRLPVSGNEEKVKKFLAYEDPGFYVPQRQRIANKISLFTFLSALLFLLWGWGRKHLPVPRRFAIRHPRGGAAW